MSRKKPAQSLQWPDNRIAGWEWLCLVGLVLAVFLAYQPAWQGGFIWDDDMHVTRPELRSWQGLYHIWFNLGATQQYYPLLHSLFWVEHALWGDATLGYHLVNILLHATAAVLVALTLRRLAIPGALLAAAIFALHPIQVESVAWITEQKNTLSAVFYLGAMLFYLRYDQSRKSVPYWLAFGLFVLGLMSKTVTATLPAALLVIFWWQRGKLSWRRDVQPLLPFFLLGAAAGLGTALVERKLLGAEGADYELSIVQRCLIAGRAIWFYLGKLFWPANLIFIYPRWNVSGSIAWQYLFPAAAAGLFTSAFMVRRRWRGPLAGLLFFVGTLFPALGFFNVYPFIYSFVADHFQYLASLGVIVFVSAAATLLCKQGAGWLRTASFACSLLLLGTLAVLAWRQSRMYADIESLYQTTIDRNPDCWMAHNNLGLHLAHQGRFDEAIAAIKKCLQINPNFAANAYTNLGSAYSRKGRLQEAIVQFQKALEITPNHAKARNNLGTCLIQMGKFDQAIAELRKLLACEPNYAAAHYNLGLALVGQGQLSEAIAQFKQALKINPHLAPARRSLEASGYQQRALRAIHVKQRKLLSLHPNDLVLLNDMAWLLATTPDTALRDGPEAVEIARRAVELSQRREPAILGTLAAAYAEAGRFPEAVETAEKAIALAAQQQKKTLLESIQAKIKLYKAKTPYRELPHQ